MFNKAIILALLVGGLGVAVAGCEELYKDRNLFAASEPKKEPIIFKTEAVKHKTESIRPKKETVRPKKETVRPKKEAVRPKAKAAKPVRDPFVTAGDTFGKREMMGGRLSIAVPRTYFISGSPLVVSIDAGKLSRAFYSRMLALRPYHPIDEYVWTEGTGRPVHDINLNTLSQTVTIGKDSPAADEYQDGEEIEAALFEVPRRNTEPLKFVSTKRMIYYADSSGPQALLVSDQIDNLGDGITIALPANAARAFPGIETAVLRAELDDKTVGIKLKVTRETLPRKYPANTRAKQIFTVILASQDDQKKWQKAHVISRGVNLTIVGRHGRRMPEIDKKLTIRGTTY